MVFLFGWFLALPEPFLRHDVWLIWTDSHAVMCG